MHPVVKNSPGVAAVDVRNNMNIHNIRLEDPPPPPPLENPTTPHPVPEVPEPIPAK